MSAPVLVLHHADCRDHLPGPGHPESPDRLDAAVRGIDEADLGDAITFVEPRRATLDELALVHDANYAPALRQFCERGGGRLDEDTVASPGSFSAASRAAGAALNAVERIERGEGQHAFCAVRPPGHHATARRPQGFCIFNNVAVCAAALAERGERVLILDWDAHHGNGTQDIFYADPRVLYVSLHQWPLYPGTGRLEDAGEGEGAGCTINFPFPAGATGDVYQAALDEVIAPAADEFGPSWLLVSCGFDSHRADALEGTNLALSAGDFGVLTRRCIDLAPPGRCVLVLEGGYDLAGLSASAGACVAALAGAEYMPEPPTSGGGGWDVVQAVARLRA